MSSNNLYNPCFTCAHRYGGTGYTSACDETCEYANIISRLKPYGTIDEIVEILKGDRFPTVFVDKDHIDFTAKIVKAAREGYI